MMRKNEKGFTLIEIITVVVIIGIFTLLVIPSFSSLFQKFRKDYYISLEQNVVESAKDFFVDNRVYRPVELLESTIVNVETLMTKGFIDDVADYDGKSCPDSYALIIKTGANSYDYAACMTCENGKYINKDNNYCDIAWKTNDNLDTELSVGDTVYVYQNSTNEEIKKQVELSLMVRKRNASGEVLKEVLTDDNATILPENLDDLRLSSAGSTVLLRYVYGDTVQTRTAIVYGHSAPSVTITNRDGTIHTGENWDSKITVSINVGSEDTSYIKSGTTPKYYQYNYNGVWNIIDVCTDNATGCTFSWNRNGIFDNVTFRIINNKGFKSNASEGYNIKFDNIKPVVTEVLPIEHNYYTTLENLKALVEVTITDNNDEGGSGVKSREYSFGSGVFPGEYSSYSVNNSYTGTVSNSLTGGIYYLWYRIIDLAGNVTISKVGPYNVGYTITYDGEGGTPVPEIQQKKHNENITLSSDNLKRVGSTFLGWGVTKDEVDYEPGSSYSGNSSVLLHAVYGLEVYEVTYNSNKCVDTTNMPNPISFSKTYSIPIDLSKTTPTCVGYKFDGWSTKEDGSSTVYPAGGEYNEERDQTLYAIWEAIDVNYTVYHYLENTSSGYSLHKEVIHTGKSNSTVNVSDIIMVIDNTTYRCAALTNDTSFKSCIDKVTINPNGSTKIYLYYDRNTFDLKVVKGTNINSVGIDGTSVTKKVKWGFNAIISSTVNVEEGYIIKFKDWTNQNGTVVAKTNSATYTMPEGNTTLTANATKTARSDLEYTVYHCTENLDDTYSCGEGIIHNDGVTDVAIVLSTKAYSITGFTYSYGKVDNVKVTSVIPKVNGTTKIYLYYKRNQYTVKIFNDGNFNSVEFVNGGGVATSYADENGQTYSGLKKTYKYGETVSIKANLKNDAGYIYKWVKWFSYDTTLMAHITIKNVDFDMPNGDVVLKATATVTAQTGIKYRYYYCFENPNTDLYDCSSENYGSGTTGTTINLDDLITTYDGYTYNHAKVGGVITTNPKIAGDESTKIYLYYLANEYKLTLTTKGSPDVVLSGGGTYKYTKAVHVSATFDSSENPGYKMAFVNWVDDNGKTLSTNSSFTYSMPSRNVTLTATYNFEPIKYSIHFDGNGYTSGSMNDINCTYNEDCNLTKNNFVKTHAEFLGWSTDKTATSEIYKDQANVRNITIVDDKKITLYAVWKNLSYNVAYSCSTNGGSNNGDTTATYYTGESIDLNKNCTKSGWNFIGWSTSSGATSGITSLTMGNSDITLYGLYYKNVSATFYKNGATSQTVNGTANTNEYVSLSCTMYNSATSCNITTPKINRSDFTIVGYGMSENSKDADLMAETGYVFSTSGSDYYAITKQLITIQFKRDTTSVKTQDSSTTNPYNKTCTIWNKATTCSITSPTVEYTTGYIAEDGYVLSTNPMDIWKGSATKPVNSNCLFEIKGKLNVKYTMNFIIDGNTITRQCSPATANGTCKITVPTPVEGTDYTIAAYDFFGWSNSKSLATSTRDLLKKSTVSELTASGTTVTLSATNNNTTLYGVLRSHTYGSSYDEGTSNATNYGYNNYRVANYWGSFAWNCTAGHVHSAKKSIEGLNQQCIYCGRTAHELKVQYPNQYAHSTLWCPVSADMETVVKLTYDPNGGSDCYVQKGCSGKNDINTQYLIYGSQYGYNDTRNSSCTMDYRLCTPEREGYNFDGWYTEKIGGTKIENTTKVTNSSNHTIYAHWSKK